MEEILEEKKKSKKGFVITIIILVLVILGLTGYICYDKGVIDLGQEKEKCKEEKTIKQSNKTDYLLKFDTSKVENNDSSYYSLETQKELRGVDYSFDNSKKLHVSLTWKWIKEELGLGQNKKPEDESSYEIKFDKEVEDIFVGMIGQDAGGIVTLFIMEDGTVEYIPVSTAIEKEEFKSYGKVEGLKNIVKLYSVAGYPKDSSVGGIMTILAQQSDGKLYDLESLIKFN